MTRIWRLRCGRDRTHAGTRVQNALLKNLNLSGVNRSAGTLPLRHVTAKLIVAEKGWFSGTGPGNETTLQLREQKRHYKNGVWSICISEIKTGPTCLKFPTVLNTEVGVCLFTKAFGRPDGTLWFPPHRQHQVYWICSPAPADAEFCPLTSHQNKQPITSGQNKRKTTQRSQIC